MNAPAMRAYLDDEPIALDGGTLSAAVVAGKRAAEAKGRMIVEVWADGAPAPPADLDDPPENDPYADEVRFVSADPGGLVAYALEEAADNLTGVRPSQVNAAACLARGETSEAMGDVADALRAWESVRRAVQDGCAALGVAPAELLERDNAEQECAVAIEGLLDALREVQRAVNEQDVASLADVLEYDLEELAEAWGGLLAEMAAGARRVGEPK